MTQLVVVENTTPLADSREIAERLGIAHGDFFSNLITKYQNEVEADFGLIRFENGVKSGLQRGLQPRYAMLTEDQSYVYLAYSRNTEKARACKRMLVKAFAEARAGLTVRLPVYFNKQTQDRCRLNERHIPQGYWNVETEMVSQACTIQALQSELQHWALPSGSGGTKWRNHLKHIEHPFLDKSYQEYLHIPNNKNRFKVWVYPYALLEYFREWLRVEYAEYYMHEYSPSRWIGAKQIDAPKRKRLS